MISPTRKALFLDACYQVLDNVFFRVLGIVVILVVLVSFLISFTNDGVDLVFGAVTITYDQIFSNAGQSVEGIPPARIKAEFITGLQQVFVAHGAGLFGVMLCIAATAFFVPNMLEKGSADLTFSKPVSRLRLLIARYFAGVFFVTLLSIMLIGGLYVSIWICSGYNDPGFLWSILTLVYLFALIHSVSTLIAVVSRSTVSSILVAIIFFPVNGCVHGSWIKADFKRDKEEVRALRVQSKWELMESDEAEPDTETETHWFLHVWNSGRTVLHYVLPKTGDADKISAMLMAAFEDDDELFDEEGRLTVESPPPGFTREEGIPYQIDLDSMPFVWVEKLGGTQASRIELTRRSRLEQDPRRDRMRKRSMHSLTRDLEEQLESEGVPRDAIVEEQVSVDWAVGTTLLWTDVEGREHRKVLFPYDEWLFELEMTADPSWQSAAQRGTTLDLFLTEFRIAPDAGLISKDQWYTARFGWTSPLKYNAFFSIGSSILFAMAMLALAWRRLSRIDF